MNQKYQKEDILEAGGTLIRQKGYHNTSISDLLKVCKIPKGSFYNFFKSKEDFGVTLIRFYGHQMQLLLKNFLDDQKKSPLHRVKSFYSQLIEYNTQDNWKAGCLVNNMMNEVGSLIPKISEAVEEIFQEWVSILTNCIEDGQKIGEINQQYSARELAEYIHTSIYGGLTRTKTSKNAKPLKLIYKITMDMISN